MSKTPFWSFGYRELEESRVETLHHRSPEVAKCETPKSRSEHVKDSISEFRIPGVGGVKSRDSSSQESRSGEMRNAEIPKRACQRLHFRVSDTGSWRSQESRLFITGVPKWRNVKCRNPEASMSKTPFRSFGYRELEESRVETLHHRSPEVAKCEMPKSEASMSKTPFPGFGYRELEVSKHFTTGNVEMPKCEKHLLV
jgi:hypothetical protein